MNEATLKTWVERLRQLTPLPSLANRDMPAEKLRKYVLTATFLCEFEAFENHQRSQAYYIRGAIHWVARDYPAALVDCSKAIEFQPDDDSNYYLRGSIHYVSGSRTSRTVLSRKRLKTSRTVERPVRVKAS
jgi:hypothetical protein